MEPTTAHFHDAEPSLPTTVVVLNDNSGVFCYESATHEAAVNLYLRIQAGQTRQICYLRDKEGKDFRLIPKIGHTVQRIGVTKEVEYATTTGHVLHDAMFQKREAKK